jgi:hypothetical protein
MVGVVLSGWGRCQRFPPPPPQDNADNMSQPHSFPSFTSDGKPANKPWPATHVAIVAARDCWWQHVCGSLWQLPKHSNPRHSQRMLLADATHCAYARTFTVCHICTESWYLHVHVALPSSCSPGKLLLTATPQRRTTTVQLCARSVPYLPGNLLKG